MENQDIPMNDVQRMMCEKNHFKIDPPDEDGYYTLTDRDPMLRDKKIKLPKHRGTDLSALILTAKREQDERNKVPSGNHSHRDCRSCR